MHELIFICSEMDEIKRQKKEGIDGGGSGVIELRRAIVLLLPGLYSDEAGGKNERKDGEFTPAAYTHEREISQAFLSILIHHAHS